MWNPQGDRNWPQGQCFSYSREAASGRPEKRFSDGITFGKKRQTEGMASRSFSSASLFTPATPVEEEAGQVQQKRQAIAKEGEEPAGENRNVKGQTQTMPVQPQHCEGARQQLEGVVRQAGVTARESSQERSAPVGTAAFSPTEEAPRQATGERRGEGGAEDARRGEQREEARKNNEPRCFPSSKPAAPPPFKTTVIPAESADGVSNTPAATVKGASPLCSVPDLGEPKLVPLYAFEMEKPRLTFGGSFGFRSCILRRPFSAAVRTRASAPKPPTVPTRATSASYKKLMPPATSLSSEVPVPVVSHKVAVEARHSTEIHTRTDGSDVASGGDRRRSLPYLSVYHVWQGGGNGQGQSPVQSRASTVPEEATMQSPLCQQGGPQEAATSAYKSSQPSAAGDHGTPSTRTSERGNGGIHHGSRHATGSEEQCVTLSWKRKGLVSKAASLRGCFDGVKSYQEARELHQRIVQELLEREQEEEKENEDNADKGEDMAEQKLQECVAHVLGRLEEAYYDWLVEHLCIKRRHGQCEDVALTTTDNDTGAENAGREAEEGQAQNQTSSAVAACSTTPVSEPLLAVELTEKLETAPKFGSVDTPPTAIAQSDESGCGEQAEEATVCRVNPGEANCAGNASKDDSLTAPVEAADDAAVLSTTPVIAAADSVACEQLHDMREGKAASKQVEELAPQVPHGGPQAEPIKTNADNVVPDTKPTSSRRVGRTLVFFRERH
ncbi:hypothetical protein TraAM80_02783 [Trypanosoma rangeli]|uniref:Uncharacterized protein n=1 Tax=Trypanosoma rangeli TaxID=5698 RepID=A0A422NSX1_TRYRA|nr:uncharacterized protein TraAM80_02783 [Trypanosoma rangeli]RNF08546.1 hypothetical protein TraAM80_02783 [Trypanosoma rangeli]|eukprot:RNF08546.1 hypothetical protein TraAM80_02783 [Trypanosoma rangeli]